MFLQVSVQVGQVTSFPLMVGEDSTHRTGVVGDIIVGYPFGGPGVATVGNDLGLPVAAFGVADAEDNRIRTGNSIIGPTPLGLQSAE